MRYPTQALSLLVLGFSCSIVASKAGANPIPDATLSIPSAVSCVGNNCTINQGTPMGNNLFHSFTQFSVPTGGTVLFNNAASITNIFSRVTGTAISNIDGLLKTSNPANLFLFNPNGIIFGPNAQLNLNGSFIGTTANSIKFADGTFFTAQPSQPQPLLTVSAPIGLVFNQTPGSIAVQGNGTGLRQTTALVDTTVGLHVPSNQTLALVGGDVSLDGATLKTAGGRIEVGSVGGGSFVSLTPIAKGWALGYDGVSAFGDIVLSNKSTVDASGAGGGDIQVQGRNISITGASNFEAATLRSQPGGTLAVNATESVEVSGITPDGSVASAITSLVFPGASGAGGNLTITAPRVLLDKDAQISSSTFGVTGNAGKLTINTGTLTLQNGAEINALTQGLGSGGDVTINATDKVEMIGVDSTFGARSGLFTIATRNGKAGNATINTPSLVVEDGARISTSTRRAGAGGTLTVNAPNSVLLSGISPDGKNPSGLFALSGELSLTTTPATASGPGGSVIVNTGQLTVQNGAQVSVSAGGTGAAGDLLVTAQQIQLQNNGSISAGTQGSGAGGSAIINTGQLNIQNGAQLSVSASGTGTAGDLRLIARGVQLQNNGSISAETQVGTGGNINAQIGDLRIFDNSGITTSAGAAANGGNINLNVNTLVALNNSKIAANAIQGRGGNISIVTQGDFLDSTSAITATSQFGASGTVEINTLGVNQRNSLTPTENGFKSVEQAIANSCLAQQNKERGKFIVGGFGGLEPTPYDALSSYYNVTQVVPISGKPPEEEEKLKLPPVSELNQQRGWKIGDPIIEPTAIVRTPDGRVLLVATSPTDAATAEKLVCHSDENENS